MQIFLTEKSAGLCSLPPLPRLAILSRIQDKRMFVLSFLRMLIYILGNSFSSPLFTCSQSRSGTHFGGGVHWYGVPASLGRSFSQLLMEEPVEIRAALYVRTSTFFKTEKKQSGSKNLLPCTEGAGDLVEWGSQTHLSGLVLCTLLLR